MHHVLNNSVGKTSLLNLLAGNDFPDEGTIEIKKGVHISYLPQLVDLPPQQTALDAVVQSDSPVASIVREYNRLLEQGEDVDKKVESLPLPFAQRWETVCKCMLCCQVQFLSCMTVIACHACKHSHPFQHYC
jgi:ATPase subunit of ABC transporter with duplicated ATPase domains